MRRKALSRITAERGKGEHYYCNHCQEKLSKTLYYAHKRLYYDAVLNEWAIQPSEERIDENSFKFSDSDDSTDEGS